MVEFNFLGKL